MTQARRLASLHTSYLDPAIAAPCSSPARSSQDFACCAQGNGGRPDRNAVYAFAASCWGDIGSISPAVRWISASPHFLFWLSPASNSSLRRCFPALAPNCESSAWARAKRVKRTAAKVLIAPLPARRHCSRLEFRLRRKPQADQRRDGTQVHHSKGLPELGTFFLGQGDLFLGLRVLPRRACRKEFVVSPCGIERASTRRRGRSRALSATARSASARAASGKPRDHRACDR